MSDNKCQVIDQHRAFCMIDHSVLDDMRLTGTDLNVYMALKRFANTEQCCWPSVKKIAEKARCSERTCFRVLKHLEELGYITRKQRIEDGFKKTTIYQIMSQMAVSYCHSGSTVLPPCQEGTATVSDRSISNELDSENKTHPLDPPQGDEADATPFPEESDPSEADAAAGEKQPEPDPAVEHVLSLICADFALSAAKRERLRDKVIPRWLRDYGESAVSLEVRRSLGWNVERGGRKKDPERFIGNWLRRSVREAENARRDTGADAPVVVPHAERAFEDFWANWPGLKTGREAARREWYRRFAPLDTPEKRNRAFDALEEQLATLQEQVESGQEARYLGTPAHFIRDADFGERHAGVV